MDNNDAEALKKHYPGIPLAYDYVLPSYGWAVERINAIQGKIQDTLLLALAILGAIPALSSKEPALSSEPLLAALCFFLALLGYAIYAKMTARISLPDPTNLYEEYRSYDELIFKQHMLHYAGINYTNHRRQADRAWHLLNCMTVLLVLETASLLVWLGGRWG